MKIIDYLVNVVETDSNGCIGIEAQIDVTIEINPTLSFNDSLTVSCNSTNNLVLINEYDALSTYSVVDSTNGLTALINADSILINALNTYLDTSISKNNRTTLKNHFSGAVNTI